MSWNFSVNLSGVTPASGGARELPEGFYTVTVIEAEPVQSSTGRMQIAVKTQVADGDYAGIVRTTRLGVPQAADDKVLYYWRAAFESMGYTPAQIDAGAVTVSREILVGRTATIYYKPGDKDAGIYEDYKFLTPTDWQARKHTFEAGKNAQGSALGSANLGMARTAAAPVNNTPVMSQVTAPAPTQTLAAPAMNGLGGGLGGNTVTKDGLLAALNRG